MRAHGWSGRPPADAEEARARILCAARARLAEVGNTNISEVAVTRQTVYRYFPTTDDLLDDAATDAVTALEAQLVEHVVNHLADIDGDAADAAIEIVAYIYEHLRDDLALNRLIAPGRISSTVAGMTTPSAIALGRAWLAGFPVDWDAAGLSGDVQAEFVEHLLRTLQSFVLDPGEPARSGAEVRRYLQRWVAPALRS
jgi:AcrR family transcriptional regulator